MRSYQPINSYTAEHAARYDDDLRGDEQQAAQFLAEEAGGGRALELAIGTGRIAIPLSKLGVPVEGIELAPDMIAQLRKKVGETEIPVSLGDMSVVQLDRKFDLVYLVYNTIFNLLSQDDQVRCFENAARHLTDSGGFVVETAVPSAWLPSNAYARPEVVRRNQVSLDVCMYDPVTQILDENHVTITNTGAQFAPISCRLAWPSELDLMARVAGLTLAERWEDWDRRPYTGETKHVSVYRRTHA